VSTNFTTRADYNGKGGKGKKPFNNLPNLTAGGTVLFFALGSCCRSRKGFKPLNPDSGGRTSNQKRAGKEI
jgi:hypothetical protein